LELLLYLIGTLAVLTLNQCPLAPVFQAALYFTVAEKHVQEEQARTGRNIDLAAREVNFNWVFEKVTCSIFTDTPE